jgi:predicted regulator of Ras-like GTPase activity (Roadblock/LC7/MglB family)
MDQTTLKNLLVDLKSRDPHIVAVSLIGSEGLTLVSTLPSRTDQELFSAMATELYQKGKQALSELRYGDFLTVLLLGNEKGMVIRRVNEELVLAVEITPGAKLSQIYQDLLLLSEKLKEA